MRDEEKENGHSWKPRFFTWVEKDEIASELRAKLASLTGININGSVGSWKFTPDEEDRKAIESGKLFEGA